MTPTHITVKNGKARPKNPFSPYDPKHAENSDFSRYDHFESTVQWHDCPGCEDGEYLGELIEQSFSPTVGWFLKSNGNFVTKLLCETRIIWRIVPQPQEKQTIETELEQLVTLINKEYTSENQSDHYKLDYNDGLNKCLKLIKKLQLTDTNVAKSGEKEEAKTVEGKTVEGIDHHFQSDDHKDPDIASEMIVHCLDNGNLMVETFGYGSWLNGNTEYRVYNFNSEQKERLIKLLTIHKTTK